MIDKNIRKNIFKNIKDISDIIVVEDASPAFNNKTYNDAFESYDNIVIYGADNIIEFHKLIDSVWLRNKLIADHFTRKKVLLEIIKLASLKEDLKNQDVYKWIDSIVEKEAKSYWIYKEIMGAELSENRVVELGSFCIVDKNQHKDYIINECAHILSNWDSIRKHCTGNLLIGVKVSVKNIDRGYELANKQFELFENIIKFIVPNNKKKEISIVSRIGYTFERFLAINDTFYGTNNSMTLKGLEPIDFNSSFFSDTDNWIHNIFDLLEKEKKTNFEDRIINAIDWVGKGLKEIDIAKGFVQLMISIESLLNHRGDGFIEPSILSKISEYIAFTLGADYSSRIKLEKDFKYLYGIRSTIVHGRPKSVSIADFMLLKYIVIKLIWTFIKNEELYNCKTIENYNEWIKKKRYSF